MKRGKGYVQDRTHGIKDRQIIGDRGFNHSRPSSCVSALESRLHEAFLLIVPPSHKASVGDSLEVTVLNFPSAGYLGSSPGPSHRPSGDYWETGNKSSTYHAISNAETS